MRLSTVLLLLLVVGISAQEVKKKSSAVEETPGQPVHKAKLVRVVVLARHGNRAPNLQVQDICPKFANEVYPKFVVPWAALSRVGMAENWESGVYLRKKYIGTFLNNGPYIPSTPPESSFFAERMGRNIVATYALAQGMYPDGSGLDGYLTSKPNLIPIATTQEMMDELLNCPRDGPCRANYKADFNKWAVENQEKVFQANKDLYSKISEVCGYQIKTEMTWRGKSKNLPWATKAINDAFTFSLNEGLDPTMGVLTDADLASLKALSTYMVEGTRFSLPHQMTYWVSNFLPNLFNLARRNPQDDTFDTHKFHLFLNHRELMLAIATILKIPIPFKGGGLVAGCMITFEVWEKEGETYLKFYWWGPTTPTPTDKAKAFKSKSFESLYTGGNEYPTAPNGCEPNELCPLTHVMSLFTNYTAHTGNYKWVCDLHNFPNNKVKFFNDGEMETQTSAMGEKLSVTMPEIYTTTTTAAAVAAVTSTASLTTTSLTTPSTTLSTTPSATPSATLSATLSSTTLSTTTAGESSLFGWLLSVCIVGVAGVGLWKYAHAKTLSERTRWAEYTQLP